MIRRAMYHPLTMILNASTTWRGDYVLPSPSVQLTPPAVRVEHACAVRFGIDLTPKQTGPGT